MSIVGVIVTDELYGVVTTNDNELDYSFSNYLSGDIQNKTINTVKNNIGLRNFFIRTFNQINFSVFNIVNKLLILNDGSFVPKEYVETIYGIDFVGFNKLNKFVNKISIIQTILEKNDKTFIFVIAPNKVYLDINNVPNKYKQQKTDSTNYIVLSNLLIKNNINFIDFNKYYKEMNDTIQYPLFYKYGVHWSGYSSTIVADTMFSYLYNKLNYPKPYFYTEAVFSTYDSVAYYDNDLERIANLYHGIEKIKYSYPKIVFGKTNNKKPDIIIVGDSYVESFYTFYPFCDSLLNSKSRFWYYNESVEWPKENKGKNVNTLNNNDEFIDRDAFVIIENTSRISHDFTFNFIDELYLFLNFKDICKNFSLEKNMRSIISDKEFYKTIIEKANKNKISVDEQLKLDIIWMFNKNKFYNKIRTKIENNFKKSKEISSSIKQKAIKNKVKEDSQLKFDVHWIIEQKFSINK